MNNERYKYNYPEQDKHYYNLEERQQKANKILAVLQDYYPGGLLSLSDKKLLDIGSSTGIMTNLLSQYFYKTTGIDIDDEMVGFAESTYAGEDLHFYYQDSMNIQFDNSTFDVIICAHLYEYIPDIQKAMYEIYRVLKPGGICYFVAGNKWIFMEPHHRLPFLSWLPKSFANRYLKLFRNRDHYYETMQTYWQLKKLARNFEIIDYTKKIIKDPVKFYSTEMIKPNSFSQTIFVAILNIAYWLCPTYVWILKK